MEDILDLSVFKFINTIYYTTDLICDQRAVIEVLIFWDEK